MDRDEMSNLYRRSSIDASYQVSVHLAEGFQRRRLKSEKLTDDRRRTTDDGRQVLARAHIAFGKVSYKWGGSIIQRVYNFIQRVYNFI
jgi:hypothetical protein